MIAIVGVTGSTGTQLLRELVGGGHHVRVLARDLARAEALTSTVRTQASRVDFVRVDLEDPATFAAALEGVTKCYVAVGGPTGTPNLVDAECSFIDAARAAGIAHYVKVSGIDARPESPARIQQWHGRIVEHLVASGLGYTILEPSFFMQNLLGLVPAIHAGVLPLPTGAGRAALIDARDISRVAAKVLTSEGHVGKRYVLTGPELLDHGEAARVLQRVLERPVMFQDVPEEAFEASLRGAGLPPWFASLLADAYAQVFRRDGAARVTNDVERLTGVRPSTLAAFVVEHRAAFS